MATSVGSQSGWASKEDWVRHQTLISRLYGTQKLVEVMNFMASQHGFRATFVFQIVLMTLVLTNVPQRKDVQDTDQAMGFGQKE